MSIGLLGKKVGMTRIYNDAGAMIPVTVIDISDNSLLQRKTQENDGYSAVQVGFDRQRESRVTKARGGHFKKLGSEPKRLVREFRFENDEEIPAEGEHPSAGMFKNGEFVFTILGQRLDRKAVTIPTGGIGAVITESQLATDDNIFQYFIQ